MRIRDAFKSQAFKLVEYKEEPGMRLHVPNHLQKAFRALMNLSHYMKKKHPTLKSSVKFDEDTMGLYMNINFSGQSLQ